MKKYSVIGYYEDNGQTYCEHVEAEDGDGAFSVVAGMDTEGDLVLVAAIEGHHKIDSPAEGNGGSVAAVVDIPGYREHVAGEGCPKCQPNEGHEAPEPGTIEKCRVCGNERDGGDHDAEPPREFENEAHDPDMEAR